MTTALSITNRGAELIGYKDPDDALNGNDAANFLGVLNAMVDGWKMNRLFVYAVSELVQTVSGNPVAIGTGSTLNTPRPANVPSGGFFRIGGVDYGFEMITRDQYEAFLLKTLATPYPRYCYYEGTLPAGNLYFYPVISGSAELHLPVEQQLSEFADLTTDYTLPPGFRGALEYSLAEELAPGRRALDAQVMRMAARYRGLIERFESPILTTGTERRQGNILTGWY